MLPHSSFEHKSHAFLAISYHVNSPTPADCTLAILHTGAARLPLTEGMPAHTMLPHRDMPNPLLTSILQVPPQTPPNPAFTTKQNGETSGLDILA